MIMWLISKNVKSKQRLRKNEEDTQRNIAPYQKK